MIVNQSETHKLNCISTAYSLFLCENFPLLNCSHFFFHPAFFYYYDKIHILPNFPFPWCLSWVSFPCTLVQRFQEFSNEYLGLQFKKIFLIIRYTFFPTSLFRGAPISHFFFSSLSWVYFPCTLVQKMSRIQQRIPWIAIHKEFSVEFPYLKVEGCVQQIHS